jgi:hypothetical protein
MAIHWRAVKNSLRGTVIYNCVLVLNFSFNFQSGCTLLFLKKGKIVASYYKITFFSMASALVCGVVERIKYRQWSTIQNLLSSGPSISLKEGNITQAFPVRPVFLQTLRMYGLLVFTWCCGSATFRSRIRDQIQIYILMPSGSFPEAKLNYYWPILIGLQKDSFSYSF